MVLLSSSKFLIIAFSSHCLVLVDDPDNAVNGHFRINRSVDGNGGGYTASADATERVEGKQAVFGGFAGLDTEYIRKFVDDLLRAFNVASGALTATDNVLALRL